MFPEDFDRLFAQDIAELFAKAVIEVAARNASPRSRQRRFRLGGAAGAGSGMAGAPRMEVAKSGPCASFFTVLLAHRSRDRFDAHAGLISNLPNFMI